jgi:hypothetical protein
LQALNRDLIASIIVQQFIQPVTFDLVAPHLDRQPQRKLAQGRSSWFHHRSAWPQAARRPPAG